MHCMAPLHERELILKYQPVFGEPHRDLIEPQPHHAVVRTLARILGFYIETAARHIGIAAKEKRKKVFELVRISDQKFGFLVPRARLRALIKAFKAEVEVAKSDFPMRNSFKLPRKRLLSKRISVDTKLLASKCGSAPVLGTEIEA